MTRARLSRLKRRMSGLRARSAGIRTRELVSIAVALGRRRSKRGDEPTYLSDSFPDLRPLTIPSHSRPLKRGTALNILDQLEQDVIAWEQVLEKVQ